MSPQTTSDRVPQESARISRFHNEKGYFGLSSLEDLGDCLAALASTTARIALNYRPERPWISLKAFRFLRRQLPANARVFEWSSGMSTLWYERHSAEVHAVEDNREWFDLVSKRVRKADLRCCDGAQYVNAIERFEPESFDLISVDGSHRLACFEKAPAYLKPGGLLLVDNTDADYLSRGEMWTLNNRIEHLEGFEVRRFPGWVHGTWSPIETSICIKQAGI